MNAPRAPPVDTGTGRKLTDELCGWVNYQPTGPRWAFLLHQLMPHYAQRVGWSDVFLKKKKNHKMTDWLLTCAPRLSDMMVSSKAEWVSTWGGIPGYIIDIHVVRALHFSGLCQNILTFNDKFDFTCLTLNNKHHQWHFLYQNPCFSPKSVASSVNLLTDNWEERKTFIASQRWMLESFCCHLVV